MRTAALDGAGTARSGSAGTSWGGAWAPRRRVSDSHPRSLHGDSVARPARSPPPFRGSRAVDRRGRTPDASGRCSLGRSHVSSGFRRTEGPGLEPRRAHAELRIRCRAERRAVTVPTSTPLPHGPGGVSLRSCDSFVAYQPKSVSTVGTRRVSSPVALVLPIGGRVRLATASAHHAVIAVGPCVELIQRSGDWGPNPKTAPSRLWLSEGPRG